ncbi:Aste57867_14499 [Aphanomyces stellatus]|uniref:Aste57867_14499 protein n=1 Tax=Aphanomyces stellatus TaxID=120398 RepID=A0A485L0T0_9STRA|nr:hypothetical protein As57867_014445 [Aphanomyces stellatus]VFT91321.1 Aste57867_14499 [Aphanomyces stellatus]
MDMRHAKKASAWRAPRSTRESPDLIIADFFRRSEHAAVPYGAYIEVHLGIVMHQGRRMCSSSTPVEVDITFDGYSFERGMNSYDFHAISRAAHAGASFDPDVSCAQSTFASPVSPMSHTAHGAVHRQPNILSTITLHLPMCPCDCQVVLLEQTANPPTSFIPPSHQQQRAEQTTYTSSTARCTLTQVSHGLWHDATLALPVPVVRRWSRALAGRDRAAHALASQLWASVTRFVLHGASDPVPVSWIAYPALCTAFHKHIPARRMLPTRLTPAHLTSHLQTQPYLVADKALGRRFFLVFHRDVALLVDRSNRAHVVPGLTDLHGSRCAGTVLDGHLVWHHGRGRRVFLVADALVLDATSLLHYPFHVRLDAVRRFLEQHKQQQQTSSGLHLERQRWWRWPGLHRLLHHVEPRDGRPVYRDDKRDHDIHGIVFRHAQSTYMAGAHPMYFQWTFPSTAAPVAPLPTKDSLASMQTSKTAMSGTCHRSSPSISFQDLTDFACCNMV